MKLSDYGRVIWGALVEVTFGAVLFVLAMTFVDEPQRISFLRETVSDLLSVTGQVLFPAAVAIWITYVNIESTNFGDYLRFQGAARVFHLGFIYPCLVFFATTVSLIVVKGTKFLLFTDLVVFLLAYCIAVFLTMVLNVATIMRLYGAFRVEFEKELRRDRVSQVGDGSKKTN
jgi:hypothetical protein